jgi:hypothetical protein
MDKSVINSKALRRLLGLSIVIFPLSISSPALPFGAVEFAGQNGEHERITRIALSRAGFGKDTMDDLAGKRNSLGAVGAPDSPERGLMDKANAHCDGADHLPVNGYPQSANKAYSQLLKCRSFAFRHLAIAVKSAGRLADKNGRVNTCEIASFVPCSFNGKSGRAKCEVLDALGISFHASQDFYAHSNWIDIPADGEIRPENPPGLRNTGRAPWMDPRKNLGPVVGLITGCFEGKPERLLCKYDGDKDRVRHKALNKDHGPIDPNSQRVGSGTTPRGEINQNFQRAVAAAISDTRDKWNYFRQRVLSKYGKVRGKNIICAVLNDDEDHCR